MHFSASVIYALRAMLLLARVYKLEIVSVKVITEREKIPSKFLEQLLRKLRSAGLVESHRGKDGGYTLALSPASINFLDIYQAIEGPLVIYDHQDELSWIGQKATDALITSLSISLETILYQSDQVQRSYSI